ncbi:MAG: hypothetical protein AB7I18_07725 [Candidatus Berkiella sp.]
MQNPEERIESLHCVYEAIFTLSLMPFLFIAMNQVADNIFYAYLLTAFLSIWFFAFCLFANKHFFRPISKQIITYLDKFFKQ